ncbi:MAG: sigma-54-dependent transcriptional regulator [Thiohalomonadaceae bacterium]
MSQRILIVDDDAPLAEALQDTLLAAGFEADVASNGRQALNMVAEQDYQLVLSDVHMQGMDGHALLRALKAERAEVPVLLMTAYAAVDKAVQAIRDGALDYLVKPFEADVLISTVSRYAASEDGFAGDPIAEDPASRQLLQLAGKVAQSGATVMITGESGSGKEVLARFIHNRSTRAEGPFVAINCAAIPENMLEATLFGYEKGAFTGAYKASQGKFEQAQGGTLLLDEISEMALGLQAKLLRVLQERELERLGGGKMIELDVRVLATSNRDMRAEVEAGRFREDLYYRLNVFPLHLPPLRDRPADILPLAQLSLERAAQQSGVMVPPLLPDAVQALQQHPWPGNVRELDNVMQRALILGTEQGIDSHALHFEAVSSPATTATSPSLQSAPIASVPTPSRPDAGGVALGEGLNGDLKQREYQIIMEALKAGSRQAAAEQLGISPRTLRYKLAQLRDAGFPVSA